MRPKYQSLLKNFLFNNPDLTNDAVKTIFEKRKLAKFIEGFLPTYQQSVNLKNPQKFNDAVFFVQMLQANELSTPDAYLIQSINNVKTNDTHSEITTLIETHAQNTKEMANSLIKKVKV